MKKTILLSIIALLAFTTFGQNKGKVTVAVAANMQYAMNALKDKFEKETGIRLEVIISSSGKITQQIQEGAPYDVFVSADTKYPAELYKNKFATDSPKVYAKGLLVLWTARTDIKPKADLKVLLADDVKKIAIANPKTAPYGVAAEEALKYYGIYDQVLSKLVYGESISQANQYITTLAADIGFTAKSVVLSDEMKGKGTWVDVDNKTYSPIAQAAVITKHGAETNKAAAEKFYAFLYSKSAKEIYKKYGYVVK